MRDKKILFVLGILVFIELLSSFALASNSTITGYATTQQATLSIQVTVPLATIAIISPLNGTYLNNEVPLTFLTNNHNLIWYNIDDGANVSINGKSYVNFTQGPHIINVFTINNDGLVSSTKGRIVINQSLMAINYTKFADGNSTNFLDYNYESLQNISNVTLESPVYGKITFNEPLNLSADSNSSDKIIDLDKNIIISLNKIEINSSALPNFNKSANLEFHNVEFNEPIILNDGQLCPETICTKISFIDGIYRFRVSHFSAYSLTENTASTGSVTGAVGGSGGSTQNKESKLDIGKSQLTVKIKTGETTSENITISNNGAIAEKVSLTEMDLGDLIRIKNGSFILGPGETKTVFIDFIASKTTTPGLYLGKILLKSDSGKKEINVGIDVNSLDSLFDVSVQIPDDFLVVSSGKQLVARIKLANLGETGRVDAKLTYEIQDSYGNAIIANEETIAVETQASVVKVFTIPDSLPAGRYVLKVTNEYSGKTALGSAWFNVREENNPANLLLYIIIALLGMLLIAMIIGIFMLHNRIRGSKNKLSGSMLVKTGYIKRYGKI